MNDPLHLRAAVLVLATALTALPVSAQQPLSASDWLSGSIKGPQRESSAWRPGDRPPSRLPGAPGPQPVAQSGAVGAVQVTRLDNCDPDAAGTVSPNKAGLPADLWSGSDPARLADMLRNTPARLPAMSALMRRLLSAQLTPPATTPDARPGMLYLARVDRLLDMGALNAAQSLLVAAGAADPESFRRLFDIALLEGDEGRACGIMNSTPGIAPSFAARIFCLAQTGDWAAAAISLRGAESLGLIDERQAVLLTHFLDDAFVDSGEALVPAMPMTPLEFRIHEAIGQPLPTAPLPVAFAQSDLRANNGWKARLEAAERLARSGAVAATQLRAIYNEQKPAASGGVWERTGAMRKLESALAAGDPLPALPQAFDEFRRAGMADVLAAMIAADLPADADPAGDAGQIARLLRQWQGLPVSSPITVPQDMVIEAAAIPETRRGEALLTAMADIDGALEGDLARAGRGLGMLRALGLTADADLAQAQIALLPQIATPNP